MSRRSLCLLLLTTFLSVFSALSPFNALAQRDILPSNGYFLASDAENVRQVWRLSTDGSTQMLTYAPSNIQGFAVSLDEQQIAYFSDGRLWLQRLDSEAQLIAESAEEYFLTPAFSPDGTQIAYTDGGIWIVDLNGGTSRQVIADKPLNDQFNSILRYYVGQFLDKDTLYIQYFDYGPYESAAFPALLNVNSGALTADEQFEPYAGLSMTPLADGRLLFTAYSRIGGGMPGLVLLNRDFVTSQILLADEPRLKEEAKSDIIMPMPDAVETQPGQLRFIGERLLPAFGYELFDYDLTTGTLTVDTQSLKPTESWSFHQLSPDGKLIAGLANYDWQTGQGGDLTIIELATGIELDLNIPANVHNFHWHITPTQP